MINENEYSCQKDTKEEKDTKADNIIENVVEDEPIQSLKDWFFYNFIGFLLVVIAFSSLLILISPNSSILLKVGGFIVSNLLVFSPVRLLKQIGKA